MHTAQILLIVADDLGFNDVGFQTPSFAITKTPNLDYLAHGGVVFTNHHVQPFCSPTRAALQVSLSRAAVSLLGSLPAGLPLPTRAALTPPC